MQDITFDTQAKDIRLTGVKYTEATRQVTWGKIFDADSDVFAYMNVLIPSDEIEGIPTKTSGRIIYAHASYHPSLMPVLVRLCAVDKDENLENRGEYTAKCSIDDWLEKTKVSASQLPAIDVSGNFVIHIVEDVAYLYSASISDMAFGDDKGQSAELLSICQPGNLYRYPRTGVDAFSYINSIPANTSLASTLESQYSADGKTIESAELDSSTGEIIAKYSDNERSDDLPVLSDIEDLDRQAIQLSDSNIASIVLNGESYSLAWLSGSVIMVTYSPDSIQKLVCEAILNSPIPGKLSYRIKSGREFATLDSASGVLTLSKSKAGGTIVISALFTPSDSTKYKSVSIDKTIIYNRAVPAIEWMNQIMTVVTEGMSIDFRANTNSDANLSYTANGVISNGIVDNSVSGEYVLTAFIDKTDIYESASKTIRVKVVQSDVSSSYIYIGVSNQHNATPNSKQQIIQGMVVNDIHELVLDCSDSDWKTIWIAIPKTISTFDGILYDAANDETYMFVKEVGNYKVWYWTQLMAITQTYTTIKKPKA